MVLGHAVVRAAITRRLGRGLGLPPVRPRVPSELTRGGWTLTGVSVAYRTLVNRDLPLIERACTSKAGFVSRAEARSLLRHGRHVDGSMDPYRCRFCELWHLGHRRRRAA